MLAYGAKGDAWFDSLQSGGKPNALVSKQQAAQFAAALRGLITSKAMSAAPFGMMVERLNGLLATIEAAAAGLK